MITKETTILDKKVNLAYCYGTEISYKLLADEECTEFVREVLTGLQDNRMPDIRKAIYLIMSAMTAYYESQNQPNPIEDKELIFHASSILRSWLYLATRSVLLGAPVLI